MWLLSTIVWVGDFELATSYNKAKGGFSLKSGSVDILLKIMTMSRSPLLGLPLGWDQHWSTTLLIVNDELLLIIGIFFFGLAYW